MKYIALVRRQPELSRDEFQTWCVDAYAAKLRAFGAERLIVNLSIDPPGFVPTTSAGTSISTSYDGVIEVWASSDADCTQLEQVMSLSSQTVIRDSHCYLVREFIERERLPTQTGDSTPGIKLMPLIRFLDELSEAEAMSRWQAHAALGLRLRRGISTYTRNWIEKSLSAGAPAVQGIGEVQYRTADDLHTSEPESAEERLTLQHDASGFVKSSEFQFLEERVLLWA